MGSKVISACAMLAMPGSLTVGYITLNQAMSNKIPLGSYQTTGVPATDAANIAAAINAAAVTFNGALTVAAAIGSVLVVSYGSDSAVATTNVAQGVALVSASTGALGAGTGVQVADWGLSETIAVYVPKVAQTPALGASLFAAGFVAGRATA